jgi:hypothetical protein
VASPNAKLLSDSIAHQLGLIRYGNQVGRDAASALAAGDGELVSYLTRRVRELLSLTPLIQKQALITLTSTVEQINAAIYEGVHESLLRAMAALTTYEGQFQAGMLSRASGAEVVGDLATAVREGILHTPFLGRTIPQQIDDAAAQRARQISKAIGDAVTGSGELQAVLDALDGSGGVLGKSQDWLHTLAHTDTAGVADAAGREVYQQSGVVWAELWVSVLDSATTPVCRANDGSTRAMGETSWSNGYSGPYPAHFGERSVIIPQISSEPVDKLTYGEWFKGQSSAEQASILGPVRYKLYAQGRLPLGSFVNDRGDVLTLEQLRQRESAAFKRAGLDEAA